MSGLQPVNLTTYRDDDEDYASDQEHANLLKNLAGKSKNSQDPSIASTSLPAAPREDVTALQASLRTSQDSAMRTTALLSEYTKQLSEMRQVMAELRAENLSLKNQISNPPQIFQLPSSSTQIPPTSALPSQAFPQIPQTSQTPSYSAPTGSSFPQTPHTAFHSIPPPRNGVKKFSGSNKEYPFKNFLTALTLSFLSSPLSFPDENSKLYFTLSSLEGQALNYVEPFISTLNTQYCPPFLTSYEALMQELKTMFSAPESDRNYAYELYHLKQTGDLSSYVTKFRSLSLHLGWGDGALHFHFYHGLNLELQKEINRRGLPSTYSELVLIATTTYNYMMEQKNETRLRFKYTNPSFTRPNVFGNNNSNFTQPRSKPEAMDIDAIISVPFKQLTKEEQEKEKQRRRDNGLCVYCGYNNHMVEQCRRRPCKTCKKKLFNCTCNQDLHSMETTTTEELRLN